MQIIPGNIQVGMAGNALDGFDGYTQHQLKSLSEYDDRKESNDAKTESQSQFVRNRLMRNVDMFSHGQSAMQYFTGRITENTLYLPDEPENVQRYFDFSEKHRAEFLE